MFKDDEISRMISTLTERSGFNSLRLKVETEISRDKLEDFRTIVDAILRDAAISSLDSAYSGSWGDGGGSAKVAALASFMDGICFCKLGKTEQYKEILEKAQRESDPEFQEYQRLKAKYGDK